MCGRFSITKELSALTEQCREFLTRRRIPGGYQARRNLSCAFRIAYGVGGVGVVPAMNTPVGRLRKLNCGASASLLFRQALQFFYHVGHGVTRQSGSHGFDLIRRHGGRFVTP
jgi:hypothetical protein